jgi:hypothetical protein
MKRKFYHSIALSFIMIKAYSQSFISKKSAGSGVSVNSLFLLTTINWLI